MLSRVLAGFYGEFETVRVHARYRRPSSGMHELGNTNPWIRIVPRVLGQQRIPLTGFSCESGLQSLNGHLG